MTIFLEANQLKIEKAKKMPNFCSWCPNRVSYIGMSCKRCAEAHNCLVDPDGRAKKCNARNNPINNRNKQLASRTAAAEEAKLITNHDEVWNPQGSGRTDQTVFDILMQDTTACHATLEQLGRKELFRWQLKLSCSINFH